MMIFTNSKLGLLADLDHFVDMITTMRVESDYTLLLDNYGVRRTSPDSWRQADAFHPAFEMGSPIEYGSKL